MLLESYTKKIAHTSNITFCFFCRTKSVTECIGGFIDELLRAAQMLLWDNLWLSKPRLRIVPCWNSGTCQTP